MKISIVVPIYNVEKYFRRCLESLVHQTYQNLELILVDDGSPDNCGKICDEYARKYTNIIVIHQENQGLSEARNHGIDVATGDYISFIDSDDAVELDMMEYLFQNIIQEHADIACAGYDVIYENNTHERITVPMKNMVYTKSEALQLHLFVGYIDCIACNKLYKMSLFRKIRYVKGRFFEDILMLYRLLDQSNKIILCPNVKYHYFKRNDSIGGQAFSSKNLTLLDAVDEVEQFMITNTYSQKYFSVSMIHWYIVVMNKMILAKVTDESLMKRIKKRIGNHFFDILNCPYLSFKRKMQMILFKMNFSLYKCFYTRYIGARNENK